MLVLLSLAYSAYAEESKVFTDDDLPRYHNQSMIDEQTLAQKEADLKAWEKANEKELLRAKRAQEEKKAQEERQRAVQTARQPGGGYAQAVDNGSRAGNRSTTGTKHT